MRELFANNAKGKLNAGILSTDVTLTVQAGQGALYPSPNTGLAEWFKATLIDASGNIEVIKCTQRTGDVFNVIVRAQDGTTARAFLINDKVELRWTKGGAEYVQQTRYGGTAGGTADALTATVPGPGTALYDGLQVEIEAASANATTTPTLNLTLGATATGAKTIQKGAGAALAIGDIAGAGNRLRFSYKLSSDKWILINPAKGVLRGKQTVWVPSSAMAARVTNGAGWTVSELATNKIMRRTLDFDQSTEQYAQFQIKMPKGWDEGTVTARFCWTFASSSGDVIWGLQGVAHSDDDALDVAFGTAQEVTDTALTANDQHLSNETAAITIGGTPAEQDLVTFQVYRKAAAGGDTLAANALLLGVELFINFNAGDDS